MDSHTMSDSDREKSLQELYALIQEGLDDVAAGRTTPWEVVKADLLNRHSNRSSGSNTSSSV